MADTAGAHDRKTNAHAEDVPGNYKNSRGLLRLTNHNSRLDSISQKLIFHNHQTLPMRTKNVAKDRNLAGNRILIHHKWPF